jgi:hypothetical protein
MRSEQARLLEALKAAYYALLNARTQWNAISWPGTLILYAEEGGEVTQVSYRHSSGKGTLAARNRFVRAIAEELNPVSYTGVCVAAE